MKGANLKSVYEALKRKNILVRYFEAPGLEDCLRISVGAPQEMKALIKELETIGRTPLP
jgi:histidinol-phosphate aminotransferase